MKYFQQDTGYVLSRGVIMILVIALHAVGLYVVVKITNFSFTPPVITILRTKILPPDPPKPEDIQPLPASPTYAEMMMIQPIPIEIKIETPQTPRAIQLPKQEIVDNNPPPTTQELIGPTTPPLRISGPHTSEMYPGKSVKNHESGRTALKICISVSGLVDSAEIAKGSGFPMLDEAAVKIALDTRFNPAMRMGKPVAYCMLTGISFRLH